MDEVAVVYDMLPTFVVEEKGRRNALIHYSGSDKRRCTVVLTCSAAGQRLPPTIIFRGKQVKHWSITQLTKERGTIIQVQPKAWMTSELMLDWARHNFLYYLNRLNDEHTILILDGFKGHKDKKGNKKFIQNTFNRSLVHNLTLPPNCTGMVQPLDVGVNKSEKTRHRQLGTGSLE
eukprot:TRINITY_DN1708_c0_g1_i11.p1 TRINITY_DN1708_c0_g1~~TRINITY_DN1708_c0_g1_i11.p1  ORF type:complete len:176 (-),score=18.85 TRINITY_DN1708_c0_g1_i11:86-613(-)